MKRGKLFLCAAAAISVAAALVEPRITAIERSPNYGAMTLAAQTMLAAERRIRDARVLAKAPIDTSVDPNGTGMIGEEFTETTTSIGELEAKRTTTSPDMAALMVQLLSETGVKRGDAIAVGASGSFPAATIALLSAARAMDLDVALIVSLGASSWGANIPDFNYLDMHRAAYPVLRYDLLGVSLGGGGDDGGDMSPEGRRRLMAAIDSSALYSIAEKDNKQSVSMRLRA
jgi:poly-gamma-glutamate system protein